MTYTATAEEILAELDFLAEERAYRDRWRTLLEVGDRLLERIEQENLRNYDDAWVRGSGKDMRSSEYIRSTRERGLSAELRAAVGEWSVTLPWILCPIECPADGGKAHELVCELETGLCRRLHPEHPWEPEEGRDG